MDYVDGIQHEMEWLQDEKCKLRRALKVAVVALEECEDQFDEHGDPAGNDDDDQDTDPAVNAAEAEVIRLEEAISHIRIQLRQLWSNLYDAQEAGRWKYLTPYQRDELGLDY